MDQLASAFGRVLPFGITRKNDMQAGLLLMGSFAASYDARRSSSAALFANNCVQVLAHLCGDACGGRASTLLLRLAPGTKNEADFALHRAAPFDLTRVADSTFLGAGALDAQFAHHRLEPARELRTMDGALAYAWLGAASPACAPVRLGTLVLLRTIEKRWRSL
jgi:hypothetical protein